MADINTQFLERCIQALERALKLLQDSKPDSIEYEMYRSACIKEFEIILEQSGKLLKKSVRRYLHSNKAADKLIFKDIFRQAALHGIITLAETERWLTYRDNRNSTAHDYGLGFAEDTLKILPQFIIDAQSLVKSIDMQNQDD